MCWSEYQRFSSPLCQSNLLCHYYFCSFILNVSHKGVVWPASLYHLWERDGFCSWSPLCGKHSVIVFCFAPVAGLGKQRYTQWRMSNPFQWYPFSELQVPEMKSLLVCLPLPVQILQAVLIRFLLCKNTILNQSEIDKGWGGLCIQIGFGSGRKYSSSEQK